MTAEYERMKSAFWAIWPVVMEGLEPQVLHNRPAEFWKQVKNLHATLGELLDDGKPVVACVGLASKTPSTLQAEQRAVRVDVGSTPPGRSAVVGADSDSKKTCETCFHRRHLSNRHSELVCKCHASQKWMMIVGAANHCVKYVRKPK